MTLRLRPSAGRAPEAVRRGAPTARSSADPARRREGCLHVGQQRSAARGLERPQPRSPECEARRSTIIFVIFSADRCLMMPSLASARSAIDVPPTAPGSRSTVMTTGFKPPAPPPATARIRRRPAPGCGGWSSTRPSSAKIVVSRSVAASSDSGKVIPTSCATVLRNLEAKDAPRCAPRPPVDAPTVPSALARSSSSSPAMSASTPARSRTGLLGPSVAHRTTRALVRSRAGGLPGPGSGMARERMPTVNRAGTCLSAPQGPTLVTLSMRTKGRGTAHRKEGNDLGHDLVSRPAARARNRVPRKATRSSNSPSRTCPVDLGHRLGAARSSRTGHG